MAKRFVAVAALGLFFFQSRANAGLATVWIWFDASGLNPQSGVATQGVEGGDLALTCDTSAGPAVCQWRVNMHVHNLLQLASMGTDLLGDTAVLAISDATHGDFPGDAYEAQGHNYQTPNAGGLLADLRSVSVPLSPPNVFVPSQGAPGFYNPVSFTLTASKLGNEQGIHSIDARVNSLVWAHINEAGNAPFSILGFGDAPLIPGNIQGGIAAGVIQVNSVPEPVSGLLLIAAVAFLRRR